MIVKSAEFITSAARSMQFPKDSLRQIVISGRSNVGKSSFINAILNQKKLARTSQVPGKTRLINFFLINKSFYLVDIPGYGYANVSKEMLLEFNSRLEAYFTTSKNIALAILLLDIRHEPTSDDILMKSYFAQQNLRTLYVLTKADKLSNNQIAKMKQKIKSKLQINSSDDVIIYSAKTKLNTDKVLKYISNSLGCDEDE